MERLLRLLRVERTFFGIRDVVPRDPVECLCMVGGYACFGVIAWIVVEYAVFGGLQ